jgi:hypothetical protein
MLGREKTMPIAIVDRRGGRAVVREGDGRIYVLDCGKAAGAPQDGSGVHLGFFLQPAMTQLTEYDAGEYPYERLQSYLKCAHGQEGALLMILISVDPEEGSKTRRLAAQVAFDKIADPEIRDWICATIKETPLPAIADIAGVPHEELKSFLESLTAG